MKICLLYHGAEFPPAERIEKEARALSRAGHEVFLVCNNYGKFDAHEEQVGPVHVFRVRPTLKNETLNRILKFPIFFNPLWFVQLYWILRKSSIDAIQVIDLPLAPAALFLGRIFGIPVVYDMWENYPEALKTWAEKDWKTALFKNYRVARAVERFGTKHADHILTVVEEQRDRLIAEGVSSDRISVVGNTVELDEFCALGTSLENTLDQYSEHFKLFFVGNITIERGLDLVIRAIPLAVDRVPSLAFFIAGNGPYVPSLKSLAEELGVADRVHFLDYIAFSTIPSHIESSDLCLVPHLDTPHINTTIPNKLFQYMVLEKPVLVSSVRPLARTVRECQCGYIFDVHSVEDLAEQIVQAYQDRDTSNFGKNGRRAVEEKYNWDVTARTLVEIYRSIDDSA